MAQSILTPTVPLQRAAQWTSQYSPPDPTLRPVVFDNTTGQNIHSTRYTNYSSSVWHPTYIRVLEDVDESYGTPGDLDAQRTIHGYFTLRGLKKGDIFKVLERWWDHYWLGECDGRRGFFLVDHKFEFVLTSKVRAIWPRDEERGNEMSFLAGAEMQLLYPHDRIWVWAMQGAGNQVGVVPLSFIECMPPEFPSSPGEEISPPTPQRPYGSLEWIPSEIINAERQKVRALQPFYNAESRFLRLEKNDVVEILAQPLDEWWVGLVSSAATEGTGHTIRIGIFPQNHVHTSMTRTPSPVTGRALVKPPWTPYYVRALYSMEPDHSFELRLVQGEILEVETVCDDHWWRGRNRNCDVGWFPENYVIPVLSRFRPLKTKLP